MQIDVIPLIERVKNGDRKAFDELYKIYYFPIRSYAELLLSKAEAEDTVQDVFLNVWLYRERLNPALSFRSYLLRSVYNSAMNKFKRMNYSNEYSSAYKKEIDEIGFQYYDPDANEIIRKLYNTDLRNQIEQAIESLSPKCREAFKLSYIEDLPSKEISARLGVSLSTVENHIYAALKQLRIKLGMIKTILLLFIYNIL